MKHEKAGFEDIYNQPDARAYYDKLGDLGYEIPQHGADVFAELISTCFADDPPTVLDVCCSYGVGGVLLKTDLSLDEVYEHYRHLPRTGMDSDQVLKADAELVHEHLLPHPPAVFGLDVAPNATRYAVASDALDGAFNENLEGTEPSPRLHELMQDVDLITTTGGVGYVTDRTFGRLLAAAEQTPWVAAFCLRAYDFGPIEQRLAEFGLVTERCSARFVQRRFADAQEQSWALEQVRANGWDPTGIETDGHLYADFYLSRPADDVSERSLADVLPSCAV